ncbi:hypothetical protein [Methylobacterium sp. V23]|uniref:hypothetical protein n=1 Tax=Methylobacterium sp. V23 TaxID=2044878 RepID=UPI000CDA5AC4|nr:hypothetical protein [Methylobacterium sp. V23]POR40221.1 hypothetical protein CRT23_25020 [Methylobacterium sp. V23]
MVAGLETFAKVRALHERTDNPGEKAAAAGRMETLARKAGMTTVEAVSKLDGAPSRPVPGVDWSAFADVFWRAEAATDAADGPEASCQRRGLPIYDPDKVEPWCNVAEHCRQLEWIIPKAHGGRFLTKEERARLKVLTRHYGSVKNSTAGWIESVLARCEAARQSWRDRGRAGVRPDRKATESDIEKVAELVAAAKRREASKLDEPEGQSAAPRNPFEALFNTPEFRAQQAERQRRDAERRVAALAEYGSEDAVFAETEHERALEAACRPLIVRKPIIGGDMDTLLGWDFIGGGDFRPEVREAVAAAYDLPVRPREAWEEWQGWDRIYRDREAFFRDYGFPVWVEARRHVVEELLNEAPARSMNDLRARLSWIDYLKSIDLLGHRPRDDALLATLRADIERMGTRIRDQAASVQNGQGDTSGPVGSPNPGTSNRPVQSGQPRRTNAEKRRDVLALLNLRGFQTAPLTDREIARRAGVSPQTVGNIRRRTHD